MPVSIQSGLQGRPLWIYLAAVGGVFTAVFVINAYICDDAFFSFRVIDNWVRGYGLRWNVAERVQTFTNPLHTLVIAALYAFIHDPSSIPNANRIYFTSLFVSYGVSLAAILCIAWRLKPIAMAPLLLLLLSSQAFVSFTSSGLETPWIYLFIAVFYLSLFFGEFERPRDYFVPFVCAGLCLVNRLDTALLFFPACVYLFVVGFKALGSRIVGVLALAGAPLIIWLVFSLTYFGFVLPNAYYAKLGLDVADVFLHEAGMAYLKVGFSEDPITLLTIAAGVIISIGHRKTLLAGVSSALYVYYVYSVGGDFIGHRFLAPPFLLCAMILVFAANRHRLFDSKIASGFVCAVLVVYSAIIPSSPIRVLRDGPAAFDVAYYFPASNLARWRPGKDFPFAAYHHVKSPEHCRRMREKGPEVSVSGGGFAAFCRGPGAHVINHASIADPLLARLVVRVPKAFLPGHVFKPVPTGYEESIEKGENVIADRDLHRYYQGLRIITRGPIFAANRWSEIWRYNFASARRFDAPYPSNDTGRLLRVPSMVDHWNDREKTR